MSAGELVVLFSDSGPGVPEDIMDRIFDPYFSTKPDGVGLGLTIAGETAEEYDGSLELVLGGPLPGGTFRVTLRRRLGGTDA
jgi:C4-dicarboxylate-specific signal transduction histidine kinase